jgi:nicotinate-nucleotide adenylyltransferase
MTKLGLFGGSFDPIHKGHLTIAQAAFEQLKLDQVHFITAAQNPQKPSTLSATQRHQLVQTAIKNEEYFLANDIEILRPSPSYSSETISAYQDLCPNVDLYWIMGADAFANLYTWYHAEKFAEINIIVYPRQSHPNPEVHKFLLQDKVHFLNEAQIAISSSGIRELILNPPDDLEDKLKKLLPEPIKTQIHEHYS